MIATVTLNPSVDISYKLDTFELDTVNRVSDTSKTAGGKGLNVARVLKQLGEETGATGFLGGSLGSFIRTELSGMGIQDQFIEISGETRNCIAILHEGKQSEILESGPKISEYEANLFLEKFAKVAEKSDVITISGSLPAGLGKDFYQQLLKIAKEKGKRTLLDTSGDALEKALWGDDKPFLVKPNTEELVALISADFQSKECIVEAIQASIFDDVEWVVVTRGGDGAIVRHQDRIYDATIPSVDVVNPVGSGDSVVAGFAAAFQRGYDTEQSIKFGLTMGTLNAMEEKTGHINPDKIDWCTNAITVKEININ